LYLTIAIGDQNRLPNLNSKYPKIHCNVVIIYTLCEYDHANGYDNTNGYLIHVKKFIYYSQSLIHISDLQKMIIFVWRFRSVH